MIVTSLATTISAKGRSEGPQLGHLRLTLQELDDARGLGFGAGFHSSAPLVRRPSGVLDESREKPPFFPPFTAPKKRARESPQGGGGPRVSLFMEDADPARSGVDPAWGRIPPSVGTLHTLSRFSLLLLPPFSFPPYPPSTPPPTPPLPHPPPVSLLPVSPTTTTTSTPTTTTSLQPHRPCL